MSKACKIAIFVTLGVVVVAGIVVGILAGTGQFKSSSSSNMSTCASCYTPICTGDTSCQKASVVLVAGTGTTQFTITGNNWPCHQMQGSSDYASCPTVYSETKTFPVPSLCATGQYFNGSACATFDYSTVQPQYGDVGFMGRPPTKSSHWSTTNVPIEAVTYDPLPAECGDITGMQKCEESYTGQKRFSVMDQDRLKAAGVAVTFDDGSASQLSLDDYNSHVQPVGTVGIYHYHGYAGWDNGTAYADYVVGYTQDGVPIMGRGSKLTSGSVATSSYSLKTGGQNGQYHMDYEYIANQGTLDELNGGMFTIDGTSQYAYCTTSGYPYVFRNYKGSFTESKKGPPPS